MSEGRIEREKRREKRKREGTGREGEIEQYINEEN